MAIFDFSEEDSLRIRLWHAENEAGAYFDDGDIDMYEDEHDRIRRCSDAELEEELLQDYTIEELEELLEDLEP